MEVVCIATDIGGTHCRCILFRGEHTLAEESFGTDDFDSLSACFR
jgi:glucokinase